MLNIRTAQVEAQVVFFFFQLRGLATFLSLGAQKFGYQEREAPAGRSGRLQIGQDAHSGSTRPSSLPLLAPKAKHNYLACINLEGPLIFFSS
jgi:hypothetical protein